MEGLDAMELAERLQWEQQDYWLHLEAGSPLEKYPAKQHARRVADKLGVPNGLISLPGAPARNIEDSDMPATFRQRRYFYYISGCNAPNCHVTYDIQNDIVTLFIPRINPERVIYNGRGSTPAEAMDKYDIDAVLYLDQTANFISKWMNHYKGSLYILHASQNPFNPHVRELGGFVDSTSLQPAMNLARLVKDDHEIKLIKKANDISSYAHKKVLANILRFKNEAEVQGLFLDVCISRQAKQQAYDPIAASGPNASTLHYDENNEDFGDRQLMCLDAGCEWQLYASDITRTFPLSGNWPSEESRQIYRLVERMQESCIDRLMPGVRYLDLHILAHQIAIDGLLKLGILHNGTREEIYKAGTSRAFFMHGLGHHVGLEVHDVGQAELMSATKGASVSEKAPSLYPENFHEPVYDPAFCMAPTDPLSGHLEEGMVVTVEPGIYFSAYALGLIYLPSPIHSKYINLSVLKRYLPVGGVRIEDDILITAKGHENLTTAPKGDAMLEIIRSHDAEPPSNLDLTNSEVGARNIKIEPKPSETEKKPLLRAPGISRDAQEPILKPVERAATLPALKNCRNSLDLEPFAGPSLFSNFQRASTFDVSSKNRNCDTSNTLLNTLHMTTKSRGSAGAPVCGDDCAAFRHTYLEPVSTTSYSGPRPRTNENKPACKRCEVLVQTIERLRQNFPKPEQGLPESKKSPELNKLAQNMLNRVPQLSTSIKETPVVPDGSNIPLRRQTVPAQLSSGSASKASPKIIRVAERPRSSEKPFLSGKKHTGEHNRQPNMPGSDISPLESLQSSHRANDLMTRKATTADRGPFTGAFSDACSSANDMQNAIRFYHQFRSIPRRPHPSTSLPSRSSNPHLMESNQGESTGPSPHTFLKDKK